MYALYIIGPDANILFIYSISVYGILCIQGVVLRNLSILNVFFHFLFEISLNKNKNVKLICNRSNDF